MVSPRARGASRARLSSAGVVNLAMGRPYDGRVWPGMAQLSPPPLSTAWSLWWLHDIGETPSGWNGHHVVHNPLMPTDPAIVIGTTDGDGHERDEGRGDDGDDERSVDYTVAVFERTAYGEASGGGGSSSQASSTPVATPVATPLLGPEPWLQSPSSS